jgi:hypothetical protein
VKVEHTLTCIISEGIVRKKFGNLELSLRVAAVEEYDIMGGEEVFGSPASTDAIHSDWELVSAPMIPKG